MLAIRLQRTGRKGHAQFRVIVQEARLSPTSGRVVAYIGSYNPHNKEVILDKEKTELFLKNGAQPSESAVNLLKKEGVKLPNWVAKPLKKEGKLRNAEKLRKNRPAGAPAPEPTAEKAETAPEAVAEAEEAKPVTLETAEEAPTTEAEAPADEPVANESVSTETTEVPAAETTEAPAEPTPEEPAATEPEPTKE